MAETIVDLNLNTRTGSETPLPNIRWGSSGRLQQQWEIVAYENRAVVSVDYEWRDVPTEDPAQ